MRRVLILGGLLASLAGLAVPRAAGQDRQDTSAALAPAAIMSRDSSGHITVRAVRIEAPPRIDGVLDEELYRRLPAITGFIQQDPDEGQLATEQTLVWILF